MRRALALGGKIARGILPVLIEGEPRTGKAALARHIHTLSDRAARPLVPLDCASLPWDQASAILFGIRRHGATSQPGKVVEAQGGTLLLREVGDLPDDAQARLARLIEAGEITPVGGTRPERANVRIIATSTRRLVNLARAGEFREDLYYRLAVQPVYLPPLRERRGDIVTLFGYFAAQVSAETGRAAALLAPEAQALLLGHDWPGNLRELEALIYRATLLAAGRRLEPVDFPALLPREEALGLTRNLPPPSAPVHVDAAIARPKPTEGPVTADRFLTIRGEVTPLARLERDLIAFALKHYGGRMSQVARALGIGRSTLYRKLREHRLDGGIAERDAA